MAVVVNKPLPEFEAVATGNESLSNQSLIGQTVVLYFYPKDNTPGCTTEAMEFRDKYKDFVKAGATVYGVSRDNMKSHDDFKEKLELPFELIADTEEKMCHMFGVVKNKIMYGKKVKGIERSTFLVGTDGVLKQEWRGLKVAGHVEEVLKAVKALKKLEATA
ncbi:MAG: peroxiredoxin [Betaproteobacteria bacterium]|jgi:peroxiredoxin Q/BCP|nr:peroxiredoxin [Betaproteobacteria bacterium]